MLVVLCFAAPLVLIGGALYRHSSGRGWLESISGSYMLLMNVPGARTNETKIK